MREFLLRHSLLLVTLLLLITSFQMMSASLRYPELPRSGARVLNTLLFPLEKLHHEITESTKYIWSHYLWLQGVEKERNELRERLKELEARNSHLVEFENENRRLRTLLNFTEETSHRGVLASVVGRDPSNWVKTITIDRGSSHGLRAGLAVVDGNGVVGQTTAVSADSSTVLLLTDSTSAIDAIVQSSRATGISEGTFASDILRLRYVEKLPEFEIRLGERVITSGMDGVYPKGTLIGVIHRVELNHGGLFQYVEVKPSVDIRRLEEVMVLIPEKKLIEAGGN